MFSWRNKIKYCIQPIYCTVCLGFQNYWENLLVKYAPYKGTLKITRGHHERIIYDAYAIFVSDCLYKSICCGYSFEMPRLVETI